ncbi:hypothetical protein D3C73_1527040 [compost metagenome]
MFQPVFADVSQVKLLRHLEIQLNRSALPAPAKRIQNVKIDLRPVKSAVPLIHPVIDSPVVQHLGQSGFRLIP